VAYVDGRVAGGKHRLAAGRNTGLRHAWLMWTDGWQVASTDWLRRRRVSQNRDVSPAAWLRGRMDWRAGTSNPAVERHDGLLYLFSHSAVIVLRSNFSDCLKS